MVGGVPGWGRVRPSEVMSDRTGYGIAGPVARADGRGSYRESYDPGEDAGERYPDWVIRHRAIGVPELMDVRRKVILLDRGSSRGERRASLAHAVAHLDLDHVAVGGFIGERQERDAERLAALRCVSIRHLADAIKWHGQTWSHVAEAVEVDERMLRVRLDMMHPAHRAQLRVELAGHLAGLTA